MLGTLMLFLCVGPYIVNSWTAEGEKNARTNTIKSANYDRLVRPSESVLLRVGLHLLTINDLDIKTQELSMTGWISATWEDERLKWATTDYDSEQIFAYDTEIWKPELFIDNAVDAVSILNDPYLQFRVENTGEVEWELPKIIVAYCSVDVQFFPFDKQSCLVELTSWAYTVEELMIQPLYEEIKTEEISKNAEWDLVSSSVETRNFTETKPGGGSSSYSVIDFTIIIKRNPSHYISSIILPIIAVSILSVVVFVLPVESGEKVGFILTVLLAEAVLLTLVQDSMPSSSQHTSYLSVYLAITLVLGVICVILSVIVIRVHNRSPNKRVPNWVKTMMLRFCIPISFWNGCCCCFNCKSKVRPKSVDRYKQDRDDNENETIDIDHFEGDHLFAWTEVAAILDWFFFVLIGTVTVLITVILMLIIIIGGNT